ncbi:MAG: class I SAM-dependent methyltransferase, partial [Sporichthyaceae bacterium]|nr:class I SAM-dependent methyltransferase [Sporichthyaceae bacterium]
MIASLGFDDLLAEAESVPVEGWDFSWFEGRATEQRPPWGYSRMLADRLAGSSATLDVQTGGGEVLAEALARAATVPAVLAATESWPPNAELARRNLAAFAARVAEIDDDAALPFAGGSFDLVASRHPTVVFWPEVARVLKPGGIYLSQQVGAGTVQELRDFILGPQPARGESADRVVARCEQAHRDRDRGLLRRGVSRRGGVVPVPVRATA